MAKSKHFYIRKAHRYLGIFLGIQFLGWTIGGLYFSWTNIDEVHGDFQKREAPLIAADAVMISPAVVMNNIKAVHPVDSLVTIQLVTILNKPYYQVKCVSYGNNQTSHDHNMHMSTLLADAETGRLRGPLTKEEAIAVAKNRFNGDPVLKRVEYLTKTGQHHEYRESALPAWAITFDHPTNTTVYVSAEQGTVQKFRNNKWRVFDFLWMMHTMDYKGRDDINNLLLRIFSLIGLITIISGFALFFISSKTIRRIFRKRTSAKTLLYGT